MSSPVATAAGSSTVPAVGWVVADRRPWRVAASFVVPYLILMLCWAFSGPPNTGPDEADHLVKAIGMSSLDIGADYTGPALGAGIGLDRNRSISRVIEVPANLVPSGYSCELRKPSVSAGCLPAPTAVTSTQLVSYIDPLGSYPPYLYAPIGWATQLASSSTGAFLLARTFCALACSLLLLLGSAHLVRWLGHRSLLGAAVALTPMVVFCGSVVTTSGIEICAAFATTCIVLVALRRPDSLLEPGGQLLLAGVGATLILSRQLGVITFTLLMLVLLIRLGPRFFLHLLTRRRPAFLVSLAVLLAAALSVVIWEQRYDHPDHVGSAINASALGRFTNSSYGLVRSGVAMFGWGDTNVPNFLVALWIVAFVVLFGVAVLLGDRADRWTLMLWSALVLLVAYTTYATVFFPVQAGLQGRHMLAVFLLLPLLAGVVVVERLDRVDATITRRMFRIAAVVMPVLQFASLYVNSRRYATGVRGPVWFLPGAQWQPPLGWEVWLIGGAVAGAALGWRIWTAGRIVQASSTGDGPGSDDRTAEGIPTGVER